MIFGLFIGIVAGLIGVGALYGVGDFIGELMAGRSWPLPKFLLGAMLILAKVPALWLGSQIAGREGRFGFPGFGLGLVLVYSAFVGWLTLRGSRSE